MRGSAAPLDDELARTAMMRDRTAEAEQLAERVRAALVEAALAAYEDAALRGLCCEGAWEVAVSAMRRLDLRGAAGPDQPTEGRRPFPPP